MLQQKDNKSTIELEKTENKLNSRVEVVLNLQNIIRLSSARDSNVLSPEVKRLTSSYL